MPGVSIRGSYCHWSRGAQGCSAMTAEQVAVKARDLQLPGLGLGATLRLPASPRGIIVFAHGSGSSRFSPRNSAVAGKLNQAHFATLLLDLLTPSEEADRRNVFDIPLLADRLAFAVEWIDRQPELRRGCRARGGSPTARSRRRNCLTRRPAGSCRAGACFGQRTDLAYRWRQR